MDEKQKPIEFLERKVRTQDEVLAELMAEHIALKKVLGNSDRRLGAALMCGTKSWISSGTGRKGLRQAQIHAERDRKLEEARRQRRLRRQQAT